MLLATPRQMAALPRTPSVEQLSRDFESSSDRTSSSSSSSGALWRFPGDWTTPARQTTNPSPLKLANSAHFVVCSGEVMEDDPFLEPANKSGTVEKKTRENRQDDSEEDSEDGSQAGSVQDSEEDSSGRHHAARHGTTPLPQPRGLPPGLLNFLQSPSPAPDLRNPPPPSPSAAAQDRLADRLEDLLRSPSPGRAQTPPPRPPACCCRRRPWQHQFYFRWEELETRDNARMALRTLDDYRLYGFRRRITFDEAPRQKQNVSPTPSERGDGSGDESEYGGEGDDDDGDGAA